MDCISFWEEVGQLMARVLPPEDDGWAIFDTWYATGEEYRMAGRSPAALVAAIVAAKVEARPQ